MGADRLGSCMLPLVAVPLEKAGGWAYPSANGERIVLVRRVGLWTWAVQVRCSLWQKSVVGVP